VPQFASPDDVKAHLNITKAINDDELGMMLDAAGDVVVSLVGSFDAEAVTERVTANGGTVVLARRPASGVQTQRGPASSSGPLAATPADDLSAIPGLGYAIPNRARELLQPYLPSVQIA
jgi:hypothetical protein